MEASACRHRRRSRWLPGLALALLACGAWANDAVIVDPPRGDVRAVVFGDFNGPYGSVTYPPAVARVVAAIVDVWRPDVVLLPGDLIAGQDRSLPDERFPAMWAAFDREVAAPLRAASIPYVATMGNHDASSLRGADGRYAFARERDAAAAFWSDPDQWRGLELVDAAAPPFRFAARAGPLFVAVIDASGPLVDASQRAWLADVLRTPGATEAALRIVMGHLPLVGIALGRDRDGEVVWQAEALRDTLLAGAVDLYVSGHQAAYYPGRWEGLELLFAGGVGGRALRGWDAPPRSAVTLVDAWLDPPEVRYTTFDPVGFRPYPAGALPPSIAGHGGVVERSPRDPACPAPHC
jgi:3',5'-cyclic AMP phosphodiesterase CpdA